MYKIIARITDGRNTLGYRVTMVDGSVFDAVNSQVFTAAHNGLVVNARYNIGRGTLEGVGVDLRKLPVVLYKGN